MIGIHSIERALNLVCISTLPFFNMHLLFLHAVGFGHCFVQMLTLVEVNQHGQGIFHNTQPVNQTFGLNSAQEADQVNSSYLIKSKVFLISATIITDLQKCSLKKEVVLELRWLFFIGGTTFDQTTCQKYIFLFQHYSSQEKGFVSADVNSLDYISEMWRWQASVINGKKLGHNELCEPIKYDSAIQQTLGYRECWQASTPASSNKEKETSLFVPEESKEESRCFMESPMPPRFQAWMWQMAFSIFIR